MSSVAVPVRVRDLAWTGLILPGLGHALSGRVALGVALLILTGHWILTAFLAAPRLGTILFPARDSGAETLHPWIAAVTWVATGAVLWSIAWRQARARSRPKPPASWWRLTWRQFTKHKMGLVGLMGVLLLVLTTLWTPFIAPYDPDTIDVGPARKGPSAEHVLGTDDFGRDLFSRLLYGARVSLSIGFLAVGISATLGSLWGALSGYGGRRLDAAMSWCVDLLISLPRLVLVLTLVGLFRPSGAGGLYLVIAILGFTGWMGVSRIVRGMVLSLKEQEFIQASRAIGQTTSRIITKHLLPNALAPVIVHASLGIGGTILTEAALSFLGLGVPPPVSTWGSIIADGREYLRTAWWIATFPGLLIVCAVMSFNLLGDGLRDALDPRLRNRG